MKRGPGGPIARVMAQAELPPVIARCGKGLYDAVINGILNIEPRPEKKTQPLQTERQITGLGNTRI